MHAGELGHRCGFAAMAPPTGRHRRSGGPATIPLPPEISLTRERFFAPVVPFIETTALAPAPAPLALPAAARMEVGRRSRDRSVPAAAAPAAATAASGATARTRKRRLDHGKKEAAYWVRVSGGGARKQPRRRKCRRQKWARASVIRNSLLLPPPPLSPLLRLPSSLSPSFLFSF